MTRNADDLLTGVLRAGLRSAVGFEPDVLTDLAEHARHRRDSHLLSAVRARAEYPPETTDTAVTVPSDARDLARLIQEGPERFPASVLATVLRDERRISVLAAAATRTDLRPVQVLTLAEADHPQVAYALAGRWFTGQDGEPAVLADPQHQVARRKVTETLVAHLYDRGVRPNDSQTLTWLACYADVGDVFDVRPVPAQLLDDHRFDDRVQAAGHRDTWYDAAAQTLTVMLLDSVRDGARPYMPTSRSERALLCDLVRGVLHDEDAAVEPARQLVATATSLRDRLPERWDFLHTFDAVSGLLDDRDRYGSVTAIAAHGDAEAVLRLVRMCADHRTVTPPVPGALTVQLAANPDSPDELFTNPEEVGSSRLQPSVAGLAALLAAGRQAAAVGWLAGYPVFEVTRILRELAAEHAPLVERTLLAEVLVEALHANREPDTMYGKPARDAQAGVELIVTAGDLGVLDLLPVPDLRRLLAELPPSQRGARHERAAGHLAVLLGRRYAHPSSHQLTWELFASFGGTLAEMLVVIDELARSDR